MNNLHHRGNLTRHIESKKRKEGKLITGKCAEHENVGGWELNSLSSKDQDTEPGVAKDKKSVHVAFVSRDHKASLEQE